METFKIIVNHSHVSEGNGYNLTWGGDGTYGYKFSDEQNKKKSIRQIGKKQTDSWVEKRVKAITGKKRTPAQKNNISKSLEGRHLSKKHIENMCKNRVGMTGKKHTEEAKQKMRDAKKRYLEGKQT